MKGSHELDDRALQSNVAASTYVLAGLVLESSLIQQALRSDIMRESVTYQEILNEGRIKGLQQGRQEGQRSLIQKLLIRRVGQISQEIQQQIDRLSIVSLESLGEALLEFQELNDLVQWLTENGAEEG